MNFWIEVTMWWIILSLHVISLIWVLYGLLKWDTFSRRMSFICRIGIYITIITALSNLIWINCPMYVIWWSTLWLSLWSNSLGLFFLEVYSLKSIGYMSDFPITLCSNALGLFSGSFVPESINSMSDFPYFLPRTSKVLKV